MGNCTDHDVPLDVPLNVICSKYSYAIFNKKITDQNEQGVSELSLYFTM